MSRFESFFCIFLVCRYLKVCFDVSSKRFFKTFLQNVSSKRFLLFPSKLLAVVYMCLFFCWNFRYCYITMSRAAWHIFLNIVTSTVGSLVGRSNSPAGIIDPYMSPVQWCYYCPFCLQSLVVLNHEVSCKLSISHCWQCRRYNFVSVQ